MGYPGYHLPCESGCFRCISPYFWLRVDRREDCWVWLGAVTRSGRGGSPYGRLRVAGKHYVAHRVAYIIEVGPIPDGLELDHLCRNTLCVRPDHLEAVTHEENMARTVRPGNAREPHKRLVARKNRVIREWARSRGLEVSDRGRLPKGVAAEWDAHLQATQSQGV